MAVQEVSGKVSQGLLLKSTDGVETVLGAAILEKDSRHGKGWDLLPNCEFVLTFAECVTLASWVALTK